ncbi:recombinase family protein [Geobacter sulfurreducens]|uniref:recombinase family protein n=1 Tax=Geobacter sulfurreducens TaxID=35554 RepID=UPI000DBB1E33|nr:recombinase family protein [Geobacter sulfurreducens]BBA68606.1 DNA-invertase hin [Geobacter sulfurreducens]
MKYIAYYRVSTQKQGKSGLGLEAQRKMVADFLATNGGELAAEFTEIESGKRDDRPELMAAIRHAGLVGGRLLVGKLDRLSRDLHFILSLQKSRVDFVVCDLPGCDSFTINIYGALAQRERELIAARTRAGLAEAKKRGVKLGTNNLRPELVQEASAKGVQVIKQNAADFAAKVRPVIEYMRAQGKSLRHIAAELESLGVKTARGGAWTATTVKNVIERIS